jgi:hypothetical protein
LKHFSKKGKKSEKTSQTTQKLPKNYPAYYPYNSTAQQQHTIPIYKENPIRFTNQIINKQNQQNKNI